MINLATGFSICSKDLIYDKFVLTKEEMLNINENTYPDQFFALCSDDDCMYTFNISNPVNAETGKFRIVVGSGTGEDVDLDGLFMTNDEVTTMLDDVFGVSTTAYYNIMDEDSNILTAQL